MPRGDSSSRRGSKREAAPNDEKTERESRPAGDKPETSTPTAAGRIDHLDAIQLFTLLPIRVYHHIAEVGAGHGFLAVPLAKYAYDGKVYAIDTQQVVLDSVAQKAAQSRLSNVSTLLMKDPRIPLPDGSLDGVVLSPLLHESKQPVELFQEVGRVLKPDGWVTAIEWIKGASNGGPTSEQRIARQDAVKLAQEAGLRVLNQRDLNSFFYFLVLKKKSGAAR
jgi:ubiquinone/menaquinone biosynthesis C-methylase UbiE